MPARIIATCFALVCFAAAATVGLAAGNPLDTVLWRAVVVMVGAWVVGCGAGWVLQAAIDEHVEQYKQNHPIPGEADADASAPETDAEAGASASPAAPASDQAPADDGRAPAPAALAREAA